MDQLRVEMCDLDRRLILRFWAPVVVVDTTMALVLEELVEEGFCLLFLAR
jgi:hypothetical protein